MNSSINNQEFQMKLEQNLLATLSMNPILLKESHEDLELFSSPLHKNIYYSLKKNLSDSDLDLMGIYRDIGENNFNYFMKLQESYISNSNYECDLERLHECNRINKANELIIELNENKIPFLEFTSQIKQINDETTQSSDYEMNVQDIYDLVTSDSTKLIFQKYKYMQSKIGFIENTLNVIASRPSVGKSAFALNLLNDLSSYDKYKCIYLNMEMTEKEIYERLLAMNINVKIDDFPKAKDEKSGVTRAKLLNQLEEIKNRNITILNKSMSLNSISKLINREKRRKTNQGKHLILFIDYLGYIRGSKATNDRERMGEIVRALQIMTKDYHCTIFLLAQINREGVIKPTVENLKDTGELEQSGHCVLLLSDLESTSQNDVHRMEIYIGKNRSGLRGGLLHFDFDRTIQKFKEVKYL